MRTKFLSLVAVALLGGFTASAAEMPANIQDSNILHCFNWTFNDIIAELPAIANAGFGSIQVSPVQGNALTNAEWFYAYMPYDFVYKANGNGTRQQLQQLCQKADEYGIKIIVDVVANHINQAAGYHDTWWDSNGRIRWNGGVNYNDRYSITHGQLGEYGDVNSEDAQVQARAKAFLEDLKSLGVKGIRWDAAKHIGLPSENCAFWSTMASVAGLWHYGEILDGPGGDKYRLLKEYTNYIGVTDSEYSKWTLSQVCNGQVPTGHGSWTANGVPAKSVVYWAESHDDYSNDGQYGTNTSQISQDKIDRAYAITACRANETALYFSRPAATSRTAIKMGQKGSTHFTSKEVAEVNKFRNAMVGRTDYFSQKNGVACVTRQNGGAVIVVGAGGSRDVSVDNGGGYVPAGTYKDRVSGNTFTVTSTTISGKTGPTGIAVIYGDNMPDPTPGPTPDPDPDPQPVDMPSSLYILGNISGMQWTTSQGVSMTKDGSKFVASNVKFEAASGETKCYFNLTDALGADWDALNMAANRYGAATEGAPVSAGSSATMVKYTNNVDASACMSWTVAPGTYTVTADFSNMTISVSTGSDPGPTPGPDPQPTPEGYYCYFNNDANWSEVYVWAWDADGNQCSSAANWPGEKLTKKDSNGYYIWQSNLEPTGGIIFSTNNGNTKAGGGDLVFNNGKVYNCAGQISDYQGGDNPTPPGPTPDMPSALYILGDLEGNPWNTAAGLPMTKEGSTFVADNVSFVAGTGNTVCYFNLTDALGADWDELNQVANRYGAPVEGELLQLNGQAPMEAYLNQISAMGCLSWTIAPGKYKLVADFSSMVVKALPVGSSSATDIEIDENAPATYYNLQGVQVAEPTNGVYIKVVQGKATKVYIR